MGRVAAIASATFSEAIRQRILYLLIVFALLLMLAARFLSLLTVGEDDKIIKDIGLTAINVLGVLVALFVGVRIIFRDMERRTVQTTLATPVARHEYLVGQFLGIAGAITLNTLVMAIVLCGLLVVRGAFAPALLVAIFMLWVELMFITAVAVFFSSFSTPIFAALFTATAYLVGHLAWSLPLLETRLPEGFVQQAVHVIYLLLPNLEYGDVRAAAVHGQPIPPARVLLATLYELAYGAVLLVIGCLAFRRRDLV